MASKIDFLTSFGNIRKFDSLKYLPILLIVFFWYFWSDSVHFKRVIFSSTVILYGKNMVCMSQLVLTLLVWTSEVHYGVWTIIYGSHNGITLTTLLKNVFSAELPKSRSREQLVLLTLLVDLRQVPSEVINANLQSSQSVCWNDLIYLLKKSLKTSVFQFENWISFPARPDLSLAP